MATVKPYPTKAGQRWMVRYRKPDGRQTAKRGFSTKAAAQGWMHSNAVDIRVGAYVDPTLGRTEVGPLCDQWLAERINLEVSALGRYQRTIANQVKPRWESTAVSAVTAAAVQKWIAELDGSPSHVRKAHQALSGVLDLAVRDRLIPTNPARGVTLPRLKKKPPTFLDVDRLWEFARLAGHGHDVVLFLGYSGLRWGEMAALKEKRWNSGKRKLHVAESVTEEGGQLEWTDGKTHKSRTLPMPGFIADIIEDRMTGDPDSLIFPAPGGGVLRNKNARRDWFDPAVRSLFGQADDDKTIRLTPHDLRHTAASLLIASGASVKAVQYYLGHASAVMTLDLYSHLFDEDLDSAVVGMESQRPRPAAVPG